MKLTTILLTAFLLNAHANGVSQTITWSGKNVPLEKVFSVIKKQTGYFIFYSNDLLKIARRVSIDVKNESLEETLKLCFRDQPLDYEIENRTIVVMSKTAVEQIRLPEMLADTTREVRGSVLDEKGEPVSGATILIAGTQIGTSADASGEFALKVPLSRNQLIISSVGHETQNVLIGKTNTLGVVLRGRTENVDDIVVIGYGSVKKSDLTGAVSSISKKDLGDRQVSSLAALIQGKASGVDVSQGSIRIRGITSFTTTEPLVVIDGFIGGNMASVNPNDILSVEILKDASSTAIYGSRGGSGVILVTTVSGKRGPMKVNVGYYEGVAMTPRRLEVLNADQYTDYVLNIVSNSGGTEPPKFLTGETRVDRTDWQDEAFRTGHIRELNIDFSGGSDKADYFMGMGYRRNENPTFMGRADDNVYLRNKSNFTIRKWLRAGNNLAFSYNSYHGGGEAGNPGNLDHLINSPTYFPVKDASGEYTIGDRAVDLAGLPNIIVTALNNHIVGKSLNYQAALWAEVEPIKGLTYKIQAGVSGVYGMDEQSNDSYRGGAVGEQTVPARLKKSNYYLFSPLIEQYVTYKNKIGKHDFSAMVGNTWVNGQRGGTVGIAGQELDLAIPNVLTANANFVTSDAISKYASLSYFGRINYQFDNRYILTLNMRTDGSPKFAPGNRWGTFPSIAVAWKLHEENFIKNLNFFDQLKLRASWGLSGSDAIGDFRYLSQVYTRNVYYPFGSGGTRYNGATILNSAASDIRWETVDATSVAAEMAFLNNKLTLSVGYFDRETRDILHQVPRSISLGYGASGETGAAIVNAASMENKGIELELGYKSKLGEWGYSINANYTYQKNNVVSLGDGSFIDGINRTDIGHPVGYFFGYVADGVFMNQKSLDDANASAVAKGFSYYQDGTTRAGDVRFADVNGDGHVNNDDRTSLGSPHPTSLFGVNLQLNYRGFDFYLQVQGIAGSMIFDNNYNRQRGGADILNQFSYVLDRWQSEANPGNGIVPRSVIGDPAQNNRTSSLKLTKGDFTKIRQFSLGYSLPAGLSKRIGFDNLRIYTTATNFFSFSKWKYGYDPEVGGSNLERGRDNGNRWPDPKTLIFGFQVRL